MVKGCPLISREVGLQLLEEYENRKKGLPLSKAEVEDLVEGIAAGKAREWIRERVSLRGDVGLSDVDQLVYLRWLRHVLRLCRKVRRIGRNFRGTEG